MAHRLPSRSRWLRAGGYAAAAAALAAVFSMYVQPGFLVTLADRIWACF